MEKTSLGGAPGEVFFVDGVEKRRLTADSRKPPPPAGAGEERSHSH